MGAKREKIMLNMDDLHEALSLLLKHRGLEGNYATSWRAYVHDGKLDPLEVVLIPKD